MITCRCFSYLLCRICPTPRASGKVGFSAGTALTPNPCDAPAAWAAACEIRRMGHSTLAELMGGLGGGVTEMQVLGTGGVVRGGERREGSAFGGTRQEGTPKGLLRETCTGATGEPWKHL